MLLINYNIKKMLCQKKEHYAKWKKLVTKKHILYIPFTWNTQNSQIYKDSVSFVDDFENNTVIW